MPEHSHVIPPRPVVDDYFGCKVSDPYRYLENLSDPDVAAIMKAEADRTRAIMDSIPGRNALLNRITELCNGSKATINHLKVRGDLMFYMKALAGDDLHHLYVLNSETGVERLIVNPEKIDAKNGHIAISYFEPSWDGKRVAVGLASGGGEQTVIHVYDTDTGQELGDTIHGARFAIISWLPDHHSFLYNRLQKTGPNDSVTEKQQKSLMYLHVLGTDQEEDAAIFGYGVNPGIEVDPARLPVVVVNDPQSVQVLAAIVSGLGDAGEFYLGNLEEIGKPGAKWVKVAGIPDQVLWAGLHGDQLFLISKKGAPRFQLLRTSASRPNLANASLIVKSEAVISGPESAGTVNSNFASDAFYLQLFDGGVTRFLRIPYRENNAPELIPVPFSGASGDSATDPSRPGLFFNLTSWTRRGDYHYFDPVMKRTTATGLIPEGRFDRPEHLTVEEVMVTARDGVRIPLSIVYKKGLQLDGSNPTLLKGYGAYGVSLMPVFLVEYLAWLELGGIWAAAHVRGGGEYGEEWHVAGQKLTKPNTWRDAIDCGEYLVSQGYTSPDKLAIAGASAGGILIGRAITERPDLFGAALALVPLSDMLRNEATANGVINIAEFGTTSTEEGFRGLIEMSAYHHVKSGVKYPAVLIITGVNDPRVDCWQALKMAARLQSATTSGKPTLLRVDYDAGHGVGSTNKQRFAELADQFSFLLWQFNDPAFQPVTT